MTGVAIITGGGGGIGRAAAIAMSNAGWSVAVAGRTDKSLDETLSQCSGDNLAVVCDVSNEKQVDDLFNAVVDKYGKIDLLFNNAGIAAKAVPVDELDVAEWTQLIAINLTGSFLCARAAFRQMRKQGTGRIINNGSISATTPRLFSAPYTSSKHAITGLTKSLALDGRRYGICCGQIDLGNISSSMGDAMADGVLQPDGSTAAEAVVGVEPVCDALLYMANLPADVNVLRINVMANAMPFVGRG